jgi:HlyD family secretion protein
MKRFALLLIVVLAVIVGYFAWSFSNATLQIPVFKVVRASFEDQVTTNGRVEPSEWASARAEKEGLVLSVPVVKGQRVAKGAPIAILDSKEAEADLSSSNARIEEAQATIQLLETGGRKREIVEIEQSLKQRNAELLQAEKELEIAERLAARNAGTKEEIRVLKDKVELLKLQIAALNARRPTLVAASDLVSARARLREATASADLARRRIQMAIIRAPIEGVVYQLDIKQGSYVSPGTLVANIGRLDTLKVLVFVDEPELGRISKGMPLSITWDAVEGKKWSGEVDKIPTQIVPLGTRQVGEVECRIENRDGDLLPGTNVNAFIQTRKQDSVLLLPKEAIRNRDGASGVYLVENGILVWRKVELGSGNVTSTIALSGIKEGDQVALGPETNLKAGTTVEIAKP